MPFCPLVPQFIVNKINCGSYFVKLYGGIQDLCEPAFQQVAASYGVFHFGTQSDGRGGAAPIPDMDPEADKNHWSVNGY